MYASVHAYLHTHTPSLLRPHKPCCDEENCKINVILQARKWKLAFNWVYVSVPHHFTTDSAICSRGKMVSNADSLFCFHIPFRRIKFPRGLLWHCRNDAAWASESRAHAVGLRVCMYACMCASRSMCGTTHTYTIHALAHLRHVRCCRNNVNACMCVCVCMHDISYVCVHIRPHCYTTHTHTHLACIQALRRTPAYTWCNASKLPRSCMHPHAHV
jgi:hypothetical protein